MPTVLSTVLATIALAVAGPNAGARPDPSFGGGRGWVTTAIPGATSFASSVVTSNNRIAIAGEAVGANANVQVLVAQYRSNGTLDNAFGSNGIFTTALPAADGPFRATAIALQPSTGKLVVAGGYGEGSILLLR